VKDEAMSREHTLRPVEAVILAAGMGTRMKSNLPKVLHLLAGRPLITHVLQTVRAASVAHTVVVVGHGAARVREVCTAADVAFAVQQPQLGTGHAVQVAVPALSGLDYTVILNGDVPLLRAETLARLIDHTLDRRLGAALLTCVVPDAGAYGRVIKDAAGRLERIVEARDATATELAIGEFNTGVFCFRTQALLAALALLTNENDQGEYYLTDTVAHLVADGERIEAVPIDDPQEVVGVNTVAELAAAEQIYLARQNQSRGDRPRRDC
jgi:bifunctional UDP-N-acetylglucosamine pyrophosphorylase/glucosamine-1-phosphate N-acetyltransferase